ncbi:glycoside hydrolase family 95 protein, partial [Pseudopedobacter sp.]|uniref:glycoside hydrolase family 95 protein n=1 Tax=Pseudopedobacter sp. TaxID=1936787 RepID=UPI00333F84F4
MRKLYFLALTFFLAVANADAQQQYDKTLKLWYNAPSRNWNEALPIGNGRLGAMVFGNSNQEKIQLNEETVWSGGPNTNITSESGAAIPKLRQLIFEEKFLEAQALADVDMFPKKNSGMIYQPVGDLLINFPGHEQVEKYYRDLNIEKAVASVSYRLNGVNYKRETFASFPDEVIIVRLTADKPGKITFNASLTSPQKSSQKIEDGKLILTGVAADHEGEKGQIRFETQVKTKIKGGRAELTGNSWNVTNANEAIIYISMATNFVKYNDIS